MVRLFGRGHGGRKQQQQRLGAPNNSGSNDSSNGNNSLNSNKRRLSPSIAVQNNANSDDSRPGVAYSIHQQSLSSPMYKYALDEYAQAVAPGTSNDDGRMVVNDTTSQLRGTISPSSSNSAVAFSPSERLSQAPIMLQNVVLTTDTFGTVESFVEGEKIDHDDNDIENDIGSSLEQDQRKHPVEHPRLQESHLRQYSMLSTGSSLSEPAICNTNTAGTRFTPHSIPSQTEPYDSPSQTYNNGNNNINGKSSYHNFHSIFEKDRLDASYEEVYGPAYITGGTIKYIYPSGYQSMRPRSCPWKLSIVVCLLFTWLSIFIVGHCSDQADESATAAAAQSAEGIITDDALVIEMRWCGSRLLYLMWATSMIVTGISAAYCGVIGYIKVRDFAVANSRSQPPGVFSDNTKSDYYVRIRDHSHQQHDEYSGGASHSSMNAIRRGSNAMTAPSDGGSSTSMYHFQPTIYQSDGTPQFWGSYIYRPTQAAVAVTSR